MDEESQDNSLLDFLGTVSETAGKVYSAATTPKATPLPAARAAQPSQPAWLIPVIIGGALLLFGFIFVTALGRR